MPFPRATIVISMVSILPGVIGAILILIFIGSFRENLVPAAIAIGLVGASIAIIWLSGIRASPSRVGFSNLGIHAKLRGGGTRLIRWNSVETVSINPFLGEDFAYVRDARGRRLNRFFVGGEAAFELKRQFDVSKTEKRAGK